MTPEQPAIAASADFSADEAATWQAMQSVPEPAPEPVRAPEPAPVPEPAAAPAPTPEPAPEPVATRPEPKMVPLPELLETRRELQALRRQLQDMQPKQPQPQTPAIDPENLTVDTVKTMAQKLVEYEQERERQAKLTELRNFGSAHAQEFIKTTPDFGDAYNHLRMARAQQLIDAGAVADQNQLAAKIQEEEADLIRLAAKWNVNPAHLAYNLAQTAGYQKAAPAPAAAPTPVSDSPSAAATPPRDETGKFVKVDAKTKVEMAARGHEQASNPVSAAGAGQGGPLDLRTLAHLDGEEFDKATSGRNWAKLWGA